MCSSDLDNRIAPLEPEVALPEANNTDPDTPSEPLSPERMFTGPLDVPEFLPEVNEMTPPQPESPVPTKKSMWPARPPFESPVYNFTPPELASVALPVWSVNIPLSPERPELAVCMRMSPLVVATPCPDLSTKFPPVLFAELPGITVMSPLGRVSDVPEVMVTAPEPLVVASPEEINTVPLAPLVPEFAVLILKSPLDVASEPPETKLTLPPVPAATLLLPDTPPVRSEEHTSELQSP